MKLAKQALTAFALALLALSCRTGPQPRVNAGRPKVAPPPDSFFEMVKEPNRDAARLFYKKYIDVKGMPVVASREVADLALQRAYSIVTHLLAGRPDVLSKPWFQTACISLLSARTKTTLTCPNTGAAAIRNTRTNVCGALVADRQASARKTY